MKVKDWMRTRAERGRKVTVLLIENNKESLEDGGGERYR